LVVDGARLVVGGLGCDTEVDGGGPGGQTGGAGSGGESSGGADTGGESSGGGSGPGNPEVTVHITANTDAFPHEDGLSGQTAISASGGVRSLMLYRDAEDTEPLVLFDHGVNVVEVGYDDGDETEVAVVPTENMVAGSYTVARLSQSYSRYQVAATLHTLGGMYDGILDNVFVMADQTMLDGQMRDAGHYDFSFAGGGESFAIAGEDYPVPIYSFTAGAYAVVEDGEWAVYFPVAVEISDDASLDMDIVVDVNLDQAFRWTDLLVLGYEPGVFDVTEISYEPLVRFGGNHFEMTVTSN